MAPTYRPCWHWHDGDAATCEMCIAYRTRRNADRQRYRRQRPDLVRESNLLQMYRLRNEDYDALRVAQDFRCACCGVHEDDIDLRKVGGVPRSDGTESVKAALCIDHCHTTGVVRALLCPPCNQAIGVLNEDPAWLEAAARYVRNPPTTTLSVVGGKVWRRDEAKRLARAVEGVAR